MELVLSDVQWAQKYRPRKISDCILPSSVKKTLEAIVAKNVLPNMIFCGTTGVGKTTAAMSICDQLGIDYILLNGSGEDRGIASVHGKIARFASSMSMDGGRKCVIVDEADNMTNDAQLALRAVIEQVSTNCSFIFTCNYVSKLENAIRSRCDEIDFKVPTDEASDIQIGMFKRVIKILEENEIKYDKAIVAKIVQDGYPDLRKTLNLFQRASLAGAIDSASVAKASDNGYSEIVAVLKSKSIASINEFVASNRVDSSTIAEIGGWLEKNAFDVFADENSIAAMFVITSEFDFKAAFVVDQSIHVKAYIVKLMSSVKLR